MYMNIIPLTDSPACSGCGSNPQFGAGASHRNASIASKPNMMKIVSSKDKQDLSLQFGLLLRLYFLIIGCVANIMRPVPVCTVCMKRHGSTTEDHTPHSLLCGRSLCRSCLGMRMTVRRYMYICQNAKPKAALQVVCC